MIPVAIKRYSKEKNTGYFAFLIVLCFQESAVFLCIWKSLMLFRPTITLDDPKLDKNNCAESVDDLHFLCLQVVKARSSSLRQLQEDPTVHLQGFGKFFVVPEGQPV
ncbi:hypothetical protein BD560DRAFT_425865 [Blakeslea trispora]|nr:hypothetical protein BD560DRAFT_425865 [Blakeslea trispora]